jgi:hypothetical protein
MCSKVGGSVVGGFCLVQQEENASHNKNDNLHPAIVNNTKILNI